MSHAERLDLRSVYEGRIVKLAIEKVRLQNGNVCELEIIRHPGAAAVVPLDGDGTVHLVRQYRHATGQWLLEVPAGKLDRGGPPEACAARELEEEIGRKAGSLRPLGWIYTTPGFTDEKIWLYLATGLSAHLTQFFAFSDKQRPYLLKQTDLLPTLKGAMDGRVITINSWDIIPLTSGSETKD